MNAVLLGWAGSTERQLRLVERHYAARGLSTIVAIPNVMRAMAFPSGWAREGAKVAARARATRGPIVVHAFSNAGFWTYAAMLLADRSLHERIAAVVIDSAPGFPARLDVRFTTRAATMAMMPMLLRALRQRPALSHRYLDLPLRTFMVLWYAVSPRQIRWTEATLEVVRTTGSWPLLFLYSRADELVSAQHVEAFLATLGDRARSLVWNDSDHVRHMIVHRTAYFAAIDELIDRATVA